MSWSLIKRLKIPHVCLNVLRLSIAFCILVVNFDVHIFLFSKCSLYLFKVSCHVMIAFDLCFLFFFQFLLLMLLWIFPLFFHCFEHERLLSNLKLEIKVVFFLLERIYYRPYFYKSRVELFFDTTTVVNNITIRISCRVLFPFRKMMEEFHLWWLWCISFFVLSGTLIMFTTLSII